LDRQGRPARPHAARVHQGQAVDIARVIRRLRRTKPRWNRTALALIAEQDRDPFRVLIACILSLRTQDTTTGPAAARLFAVADTPAAMLRLPARRIAQLIYPVGFYRTKARVILGLCRDLLERFAGRVPDDIDALFAEIVRTAMPNATLCFRNFVGWTEVPAHFQHVVVEDRALGERMIERDRSVVQRRIAVCRINAARNR